MENTHDENNSLANTLTSSVDSENEKFSTPLTPITPLTSSATSSTMPIHRPTPIFYSEPQQLEASYPYGRPSPFGQPFYGVQPSRSPFDPVPSFSTAPLHPPLPRSPFHQVPSFSTGASFSTGSWFPAEPLQHPMPSYSSSAPTRYPFSIPQSTSHSSTSQSPTSDTHTLCEKCKNIIHHVLKHMPVGIDSYFDYKTREMIEDIHRICYSNNHKRNSTVTTSTSITSHHPLSESKKNNQSIGFPRHLEQMHQTKHEASIFSPKRAISKPQHIRGKSFSSDPNIDKSTKSKSPNYRPVGTNIGRHTICDYINAINSGKNRNVGQRASPSSSPSTSPSASTNPCISSIVSFSDKMSDDDSVPVAPRAGSPPKYIATPPSKCVFSVNGTTVCGVSSKTESNVGGTPIVLIEIKPPKNSIGDMKYPLMSTPVYTLTGDKFLKNDITKQYYGSNSNIYITYYPAVAYIMGATVIVRIDDMKYAFQIPPAIPPFIDCLIKHFDKKIYMHLQVMANELSRYYRNGNNFFQKILLTEDSYPKGLKIILLDGSSHFITAEKMKKILEGPSNEICPHLKIRKNSLLAKVIIHENDETPDKNRFTIGLYLNFGYLMNTTGKCMACQEWRGSENTAIVTVLTKEILGSSSSSSSSSSTTSSSSSSSSITTSSINSVHSFDSEEEKSSSESSETLPESKSKSSVSAFDFRSSINKSPVSSIFGSASIPAKSPTCSVFGSTPTTSKSSTGSVFGSTFSPTTKRIHNKNIAKAKKSSRVTDDGKISKAIAHIDEVLSNFDKSKKKQSSSTPSSPEKPEELIETEDAMDIDKIVHKS